MGSSDEITIIQELIIKNFDLAPVSPPTADQLYQSLKNRISHLLDHDMEKLLQGFYRIDVDESKVKVILSCEAPENISDSLAKLIFERLHQKALTRIKYQRK